ncbi:pgk-1 [Symbiodinium natans]|uniref:Pgk-1 protein n=1 Tax=Symbiodinium natans TaxID=878477 RepID=A0A812JLB0_9DINO|nr:pgk-1 [Symbiodinium natans]
MAQPVTYPAAMQQPAQYVQSGTQYLQTQAQSGQQYLQTQAQAGQQYFQNAQQAGQQYMQNVGSNLQQAQSMVVSNFNQFGQQLGSALDHAQGKWFAPGEALPPGFQITSHPEGHTEPQGHHAMSDAVASMKGFTNKLGATFNDTANALAGSSSKKSKKSKKKKSSGWC